MGLFYVYILSTVDHTIEVNLALSLLFGLPTPEGHVHPQLVSLGLVRLLHE